MGALYWPNTAKSQGKFNDANLEDQLPRYSKEQNRKESVSGNIWTIISTKSSYEQSHPSGGQADSSKIHDQFSKPSFIRLKKEWKSESHIIWIYYPNRYMIIPKGKKREEDNVT